MDTKKTLKLVQEAAETFADKIDDGIRTARQCAIMAFREGAENFYKKTAWHPVEELPADCEKGIIIVTARRKRFKHATYNGEKEWRKILKQVNGMMWAYKEDLI